ncbi:MAG: AAA family ATPase [Planctomycetota bacterium]|jgi:tetratricopeptide (TPR) repeat protein
MTSPSPAPEPQDPPGAEAPCLALVEVHGEGQTSRVWRAEVLDDWGPLQSGDEVAVKVLRHELVSDHGALEALTREARVSADFQHPAVARTHHLELTAPVPPLAAAEGPHDGSPEGAAGDPGAARPWLVQDFVPGRSLTEELAADGPLPEPSVRAAGARLAGALAALHAAGWVHGDVKPDNVRLDRDSRARLVDLGHAEREGARGGALGTPRFLAPERAAGGPATAAADAFALGALLFEAAVGEPVAATPAEVDRLRGGVLRPPSDHVPRVSPLLDAVVVGLLTPAPAERLGCGTAAGALADGEASPWWRQRLGDAAQGPRRGVPWAGRRAQPLVGRDQELATLEAAWERAREGGAAVLLQGERGTGKSRLVSEFVHRIRGRDAAPPLYVYGRCEPVTDERPGATLLALLRRWLHLPQDMAPGPRSKELIEAVVQPAIARTLIRALDPAAGEQQAQEVTEAAALGEWMIGLASSGPAILFLDDVNFAGTTTVEALTRLARGLAGTGLLLILGERRRAGFRNAAGIAELRRRLQDRTRTITLRPLTEPQVLALVEHTFHHSAPRLRLARALHERTGGVPGSIDELLRLLVERGWARPVAGGSRGLELLVDPEEIPRPQGILDAVNERLAALDGRARVWLERLAIVGSRIEPALVAQAWPGPHEVPLETTFAALVRMGWLVPSGPRYRFAEPVEREELLSLMAPGRARRGHLAVAVALEQLERQRGRRPSFRRAFHLREGEHHEQLLAMLPDMLERLSSAGHPHRLATLAGWGLEALDLREEGGGPRRLFLEFLASAAGRLGERAEQRAALEGLGELSLDLERRPAEGAHVYLLHARFSIGGGEFGLARGLLRNAEGLAARAASSRASHPPHHPGRLAADRAEIARLFGAVALELGDLDEARARAAEARRLAPDAVSGARARLLGALVLIHEGDPESALAELTSVRRALRRSERSLDATAARAESSLIAGRAWRLVGRLRLAGRAFERASELALRAGEVRMEVEVAARHGRLLADVGRERDAELRLRDALFAARRIEDRRGEATASLFLGILVAEQGEDGAAELVRRAHRLSTSLGLQRHLALTLAVEARIARTRGDDGALLERAVEASRLMEAHGAELPDRIVISATLALALGRAGRTKRSIQVRRALERRIAADNRRLRSRLKRQRHRRWTAALLESALSEDGPLYPRGSLAS